MPHRQGRGMLCKSNESLLAFLVQLITLFSLPSKVKVIPRACVDCIRCLPPRSPLPVYEQLIPFGEGSPLTGHRIWVCLIWRVEIDHSTPATMRCMRVIVGVLCLTSIPNPRLTLSLCNLGSLTCDKVGEAFIGCSE